MSNKNVSIMCLGWQDNEGWRFLDKIYALHNESVSIYVYIMHFYQ